MGKLLRLFEECDKKTPHWIGSHLFYPQLPQSMTPEVKAYYKKFKKLILIRDPRDIVISSVFWFSSYHQNVKEWTALSFNQKIETVILEKMPPPFSFISNNFQMLDFFLDAGPECCVVKFEYLIGEKGGGSLREQEAEIYKIAEFLGIDITPSEMYYITENLHGLREVDKIGVQTFRKGIIGQWKEYFTPQHERLFNNKFYPILERWGYAD
ncbi:MAG: sulfotransferase domain-containing protein [Chlamydiia bacterium]|nr:sulfotransferase domain-containing protein [Chlamydiia bacterium]